MSEMSERVALELQAARQRLVLVPVPAGAIGSATWPGLLKLIEECGETLQTAGKLLAYPLDAHPDGGPPLRQRLSDETADLAAITTFLIEANGMDIPLEAWMERRLHKLERFRRWHQEATR